MKVTTARFAELLKDARGWDQRYEAMGRAQEEWLLENFIFGDEVCTYASPIDRQKWDVPKVIQGRLFTGCG
jgi:hypothetical protein